MSTKFAKIATDTFEKLQLNAGMVLDAFPVDGSADEAYILQHILFATNSGVQFQANPSFTDFGDDIDNCPKNMMELKEIDDIEVKLSGTALTVDAPLAKRFAGAADTSAVSATGYDVTKVTPRKELTAADFSDIWWVGDYGKGKGGFLAIHLLNGLSTGGFQIQTGDKSKGTFAFEITGHYSIDNQDVVPYEIYIGVADADETTTHTYTTIELEDLTVQEIEALATALELTITGTTKAEKIASFIAAQAAANA